MNSGEKQDKIGLFHFKVWKDPRRKAQNTRSEFNTLSHKFLIRGSDFFRLSFLSGNPQLSNSGNGELELGLAMVDLMRRPHPHKDLHNGLLSAKWRDPVYLHKANSGSPGQESFTPCFQSPLLRVTGLADFAFFFHHFHRFSASFIPSLDFFTVAIFCESNFTVFISLHLRFKRNPQKC